MGYAPQIHMQCIIQPPNFGVVAPLRFTADISQHCEGKFHQKKPHADSGDHYTVVRHSAQVKPRQPKEGKRKSSQVEFTVPMNRKWHQQNEGHQETHNKHCAEN